MGEFNRCEELSRFFYRRKERPSDILTAQLLGAKEIIRTVVKVTLESHQKDALLCLFSDILGGFISIPSIDVARLTLICSINQKMFQVAAGEFLLYCYLEGRMDVRSLKKRMCEQQLFSTGKLQFSP